MLRRSAAAAVLGALLFTPAVPTLSADGGGFVQSLFGKKTKKRAAKGLKKSRKDLRKNAKRYGKVGNKSVKSGSKELRKLTKRSDKGVRKTVKRVTRDWI